MGDKKLKKYVFRALNHYRQRRQEINGNKALAYLNWRNKLIRRIIFGPKVKNTNTVGWLKYAHQKVRAKVKEEQKLGKIEGIRARIIRTYVMKHLKANRIRLIEKRKKNLKSTTLYNRCLRDKAMLALKIYCNKTQAKSVTRNRIQNYHDNIIKMKAIESLKYQAFNQRPAKQNLKFRGLKFWSKTLKRKAFHCLRAYKDVRLHKKSLEQGALDMRNKQLRQEMVFKIMKVG